MTTERKSLALTDAKGLGGMIAQEGFDYQLWDGLARLPAWLVNPAFEQMIFEGLEDLEARFFAPQAPRCWMLERYQAKSGRLAPMDAAEVFRSFLAFEEAFPQVTRVHTLVTPRLPTKLAWLGRDVARVRRARPFYAPFVDVASRSDAKLTADLVDTFGEQLGRFVADAVEVSERNLPDRDSALQAFGVALGRAFPALDVSPRRVEQAFELLSGLARRTIGVPLARAELIHAIEAGLGQTLPCESAFRLHVRSDRGEQDETALEIDVSDFSGGAARFPSPDAWAQALSAPLVRTARWLRSRDVSRVALSGSYRLSTAMVLGWSLRSANGFELEIPTREGPWLTDDRPRADRSWPQWLVTQPSALVDDQLVVGIGVVRDPHASLSTTAGVPAEHALGLHLPEPLTSGKAAQSSISFVKRVVDEAVTRLQPRTIKLFFAGPAAFAVALGHRWNAMPPTQLHEFLEVERRYVRTAMI